MSRKVSAKHIKGLLVVATSLLGAPAAVHAATNAEVAPLGGPASQISTVAQSHRVQLAQLDISIGQDVCDRFEDEGCNPPGFQNREGSGGTTNFY